jgi:hypothetical protein
VPRSVTVQPTAWPWRSLKFAIDLRARRIAAFWPVIAASSAAAFSISFAFCVALPTPMFTTTFSSRGTWWTFLNPNSCESLGTTSDR